ncbi:hypothetical protein BAUCODRAFT_77338 [Baudoinia panamericana UAMH 10762]|uniref:Uncharacterized protein n=1 Tax=Baudoinia panamericana (strain UAMH 10762) TaxID=717646 RepID=M2N271_BAUPA|nr:uncharacterized protein BAUCODRAFT_77338 [Baudoinia panamericana UAMH 10762]EMC93079.1 hypothetical protein BAUCODRAFT_77338 [Baudoinia panamericana UAMH 10762]
MSAPNAGRQSPDPERQSKSQLHEPTASNPNDQAKEVTQDQNKEALKSLESNPKGPLEDFAEEKTKKDTGVTKG